MQIPDEPLRSVDRRVQQPMRRLPPAVEIASGQRTSIVAVDDAIWIQHGQHLEDEVFAKHLGLLVLDVRQEVQHAAHHPGPDDLAWMHPCRDDNGFLLLHRGEVGLLGDG